MAERPLCAAVKKDGTACLAYAMAESEFCTFHDADKAEVVQNGRVKGAKTGHLPRLRLAGLPLGTADELLAVLEDSISTVREHGADAERLCYLQTQAVKAAVTVLDYKRRVAQAQGIENTRVSFLSELVDHGERGQHGGDDAPELDLADLPPQLRSALEQHLAEQDHHQGGNLEPAVPGSDDVREETECKVKSSARPLERKRESRE